MATHLNMRLIRKCWLRRNPHKKTVDPLQVFYSCYPTGTGWFRRLPKLPLCAVSHLSATCTPFQHAKVTAKANRRARKREEKMSENKSVTHWYPRYCGDYQRKTAHLSLLEHGAYSVLLDHYYSTGNPLPANAEQLHRICRAFTDAEQAAVHSVIAQYFELSGYQYINTRADEEIAKRLEIKEKRQDAASKRYANAPAKATANADTPTATPTPTSKIAAAGQMNYGDNGDNSWKAPPIMSNVSRETISEDDPEETLDEMLPSAWDDHAQQLGLTDVDQRFKSWRKFKSMTAHPYQRSRWYAWVKKENGVRVAA